ncbi:hypothetical protein HZA97_10150 [Candidatus Woesearchaeota archaeon]|nr:hypothetical protein [Candidatus Woesearchaeota archaeon]
MEAKAEVKRINRYITLGESLLEKSLSDEEHSYVTNNIEFLREKLVCYEEVVECSRDKFFIDAQIVGEGDNPLSIENLVKEDVSSLEWRVRISSSMKKFFSGIAYLHIPFLGKKAENLANFYEERKQLYEIRLRSVKSAKSLQKLQEERKKENYETIKKECKEKNIKTDEESLERFSENPLLLIYSAFESLNELYQDPLSGEYDYLRPEDD